MPKGKTHRPVGRPTKFKKDYCELLIEHMAKGYSFESFAGLLRVNRDTLYEWADNFGLFSDARSIGVEACRLFWEEKGVDNLFVPFGTGNFSQGVWSLNMKARFRKEWADSPPEEAKAPVKGKFGFTSKK